MRHLIKGMSIIVLITFVASGLAFAGDHSKDIAMFQKMNDKMAKAVVANDQKTAMAMYEDGAYFLHSYAPMMKGKEAMAKHNMQQHKAGFKMKSFSLTSVDVFGDNHQKIEVGTYKLTMMIPGMKDLIPDNGKFLTVWNKQKDGSWKIKAEIWNTDNPPMGMGMPKKEH